MTEEEIQALRTNQCVEVVIQGSNTEMLSIEDLEARWLQQNDSGERVCVPSTDILEWKAKCPLSQTTADIAASMKSQYMALWKEAIALQKPHVGGRRKKVSNDVLSQEDKNAIRCKHFVQEGQYT